MEVEFLGRRVQWDDEKNELNKKKHGFTLEEARFVFADPYRIEWFDEEHSDDEDRYKVLGMINNIVFVVYSNFAHGKHFACLEKSAWNG